MRPSPYRLLTACALGMGLLWVVPATAQPPSYFGGYGPGAYGGWGPPQYGWYGPPRGPMVSPQPLGDYREFLEDRMAWLRARLDIREDQRKAWSQFRNTVVQQADRLRQRRRDLRDNRPADSLELDDRRIEMLEERLQSAKAVSKSRRVLFAALDPDQREVASRLMRHRDRNDRPWDWAWGN